MIELLGLLSFLLGAAGYAVIFCTIVYFIYLLIAKELNKKKIKMLLIILAVCLLCIGASMLIISF